MKLIKNIIIALIMVTCIALAGFMVFMRTYDPIPEIDTTPYPFHTGWDTGQVEHILPAVNHNRFLIKISVKHPMKLPPYIIVDDNRRVTGYKTDSKGYFWRFDITELSSDTSYFLSLHDYEGIRLCDPWPLKTFPDAQSQVEKVRLLIYTCFGGHDAHIKWYGAGPVPLQIRHRLLKRALSFKPDAVISTGDQIYYDLREGRTPKYMGRAPQSIKYCGTFDRTLPVLGTQNEEVFKKAVSPQISSLYGTALRSVPTFFLLDDHDYFENDEANQKDSFEILDFIIGRPAVTKAGMSFPMDDFMLDLGRTGQKLYLPEFLPAPGLPVDLPGIGEKDRAQGVSECYGMLRYGNLLEALLWENRRYMTTDGKNAVLVHPKAEDWLKNRMKTEDTTYVINVATSYFGWCAGKWLDWYPDVRKDKGALTTDVSKYEWQQGWFNQHNRIMEAASGMKRNTPIFVGGDLHSQCYGWIDRSGELDLRKNPVLSICSGSLGTGSGGFPSSFIRKMVAQPSTLLEFREVLPPVEKDAFILMDFTPEKIVVQFFAWRQPEPVDAIDTLQPYNILEIKRRDF